MNWKQIKQHFKTGTPNSDIIRQIMEAARKYPDTCAACHWGEPCGYGIVKLSNVKTARRCEKGLWTVYARHCPQFRRHGVLRLCILSCSDVSISTLSVTSGVPIDTIKAHSSGRRSMKWETAQKYAKALGIEPGELMI